MAQVSKFKKVQIIFSGYSSANLIH
uniref:Uncharacterized protein n=1 Tax=Arundo donax TaxID=35708 RepID=A0A0A9FZI9_ARUDO